MATKSTQRIVLNENEEQSSFFIAELESKYLSAVSAVFHSIKELGIENPSKSLLFDTIQANFGPIEAAYTNLTLEDVEAFKSPAAKHQMLSMFQGKLSEIRNQVSNLFLGKIGTIKTDYESYSLWNTVEELFISKDKLGKVSMASPSLFKFIELNSEGVPYISEEAKESIIDAFRDYIEDSKEVRVYDTQQKAAKALNEFVGALIDAGIKIDLDYSQIFVKRFFNANQKDDGSYEISPRIEGIR